MAYDTLKGLIRQYIKTNGQNEITGQILQNVLIEMVNEYPSLSGYATQTWVQNWVSQQGYVTQSWVEAQGYLNSNTVLINSVVRDAEGNLQFTGPNFVPVVVDLTHTHRFEELTDLPTTLQDYGITDGVSISMLNETVIINSVTKLEDGGLKFMGNNFVDTYIDFTHTHRFEELTDLPTTLKDYGITDAVTEEWIEQNFLSLTNGGTIGTDEYQLVITEQGLTFKYDGATIGTISLYYGPDGPEFDISSSATLGGYAIATQAWVTSQMSGFLPTSTTLINSVTKSNDGGLKFMGNNFVDTYVDLTHTHRFEELTDLPTTLRDYGITDAAPLSALSNYLPITGGVISDPNSDFTLQITDHSLEFKYNNVTYGSISLTSSADMEFDLSSGTTLGGYTIATQSWVTSQMAGYLPTSTTLINSITKSNDGGLKFMGSNFVDTYVDLTHTHRFEELTDLPTTLQDYGITDAVSVDMLSNYLPLSGGTITGAVSFQYEINPSDPETAYLVIEDGVITLDSTGKIQTSSGSYYFDNNGNAVFNTLTVGGYTAATQNWVSQQGYLTSASLNDYALKSWVNTQLLGYLPTSTVIINSVVKSNDGSLKFVGSNFVDMYVDLTHTHRFEELTDLPTTLRDYGITDAAPLSALSNYLPIVGGNISDPNSDFTLQITDHSLEFKYNNVTYGSISLTNSADMEFDLSSGTTLGGYTIATQSWVQSQGYLTSASLNGYAQQSWVNTQLAGYLPTSTALINAMVKSADGSMKFSGSNFADVYADFTHAHRWEEITDRPNIETGGYGAIYTDDNVGIGIKVPTNKLEVKGTSFFYYNMGVGTSPTSSYSIDVDGEVRAGGFVNNSDARLKNIEDYDACIFAEAVAMAPAIHYQWKNRKDKSTKVGSIAQYWQNLIPEAVSTDDKGYLSMQYDVIALISAISVAKRTVEHEQRIAELERENAQLRLELNTIKEAINNKSIN